MTDWYLLLAPLTVLAVLLLVRFVGCTSFSAGDSIPAPKPYAQRIKDEASLVAYWRLGEPDGQTIAVDQIGPAPGNHKGTYTSIPTGPPADPPESAPASGTFSLFKDRLLAGDLNPEKSARFDGGYVRVDYAAVLNPDQFTIEAWVHPAWSLESQPTFRSVITSRQDDGEKRGYMLYAGPNIELAQPDGKTYWQVWVGNGGSAGDDWVTCVGPEVKLDTTAHVAAKCNGTKLELWVHDADTNLDTAGSPDAAKTFAPAYRKNVGKPLFIAEGRTDVDGPGAERYPFIGRIQDVAIYNSVSVDIPHHSAAGQGFI
jgi:hypothetical protein